MYICMYISVYIYICMYICIYIYIYVYMCIHTILYYIYIVFSQYTNRVSPSVFIFKSIDGTLPGGSAPGAADPRGVAIPESCLSWRKIQGIYPCYVYSYIYIYMYIYIYIYYMFCVHMSIHRMFLTIIEGPQISRDLLRFVTQCLGHVMEIHFCVSCFHGNIWESWEFMISFSDNIVES